MNQPSLTVELNPISSDALPELMQRMRPAYAAERAAADHISLEEATAFAESQYAQLLPQGTDTPGHHFSWIQPSGVSGPVGFVWYFVDGGRREAFIYELWIDQPHRRQGYASAALAAVGEAVRAAGCDRLGLNVFATNPGAAALYRKCGFQTVSQHMNKRL